MNLEIELFGQKLKTPFIPASGTFGYGEEYSFIDYSSIGAFVTKGLNLNGSEGNPRPRVAELETGLLNSIGLQNSGIYNFIENIYPNVKDLGPKIIVNFYGATEDEYIAVAKELNKIDVLAVEMNVSCPNIHAGGQSFGEKAEVLYNLTKKVKKELKHPLIVKLTPNVTDITVLAEAAISAGADGLSLINTLKGLAIDIEKAEFKIARRVAGYSGAGIKPVALRMVYEVRKKFKDIPIIGIGGIEKYSDVVEFAMLGVNAVQVGTAIFKDPNVFDKMTKDLKAYLTEKNYKSIQDIPVIY